MLVQVQCKLVAGGASELPGGVGKVSVWSRVLCNAVLAKLRNDRMDASTTVQRQV